SFDEFEAAIDRFPELADAIAKSGARWVVANEHAAARLERRQPLSRRLKRALENRGPALAMLVLWAVANALFFERARRAHAADNGFIQLARGFGACLNFNGALILLPMMRGVLTAVRKTALRAILPVDDAVAVHEVAGHAMFAFALAHVAAHLANYARMPGASVLERIATTPAARTGVAWLVVFAIMWFFARASARARRRFEVFHATHALYGVWFLAGVLHGPVFWKWIAIPFGVFALERLVRLLRRSRRTEILRTRVLRSGVTRLDLRKPEGFVHQAGDFVFLRVPQVAAHEWHPFTLSSAPERDTLSVHVRALGDWTAALRRLAETRRLGLSSEPLVAFVDGPYGAPCTEVFRSRRAVLIAGGIGVTPFASVLESILLRSRADTTALQRVDFVWLNRDQYSFEWFADLLASADHLDERRMLRVHVWMTGGRSDASSVAFDLARHASLLAGDPDVVTGLHIETHMGSPDWPALLGSIAGEARGEAEGEAVDVYFCGPPGLAAKIAPVCADAGMSFRQERF
ncbi:MAG TPA: ferric reductase-like transmembrane domain-containing protein, partial [Polyangiaceae bacterium]|nr:ferric reductase-like transmembrane domain-containing protein [Polyangiaceae bacterium]